MITATMVVDPNRPRHADWDKVLGEAIGTSNFAKALEAIENGADINKKDFAGRSVLRVQDVRGVREGHQVG